MVMMQANPLLRPSEISTFWAQMALALLDAISGPKKVLISGPTPSNDPRYGYCPHQNHYIPRHINNRYIDAYLRNTVTYTCLCKPDLSYLRRKYTFLKTIIPFCNKKSSLTCTPNQ
jgi:hypothetical protein